MDVISRWIAGLLMSALLVGCVTSSWKMYQYKGQLAERSDNIKWSEKLKQNNIYSDGKIVFFGDSQVAYWNMEPSFGALPIINVGAAGDWATMADDRFEDEALILKPKTAVILIGTNDLAHKIPLKDITGSIEKMLISAGKTKTSVILCGVLPVRDEEVKTHPAKDLLALNANLKALAEKYDADYVDFYQPLSNDTGELKEEFSKDGIHVTEPAYMVMTKTIYPYLIKHVSAWQQSIASS